MVIFVKSFNRPYYLERCIRSIYLNIVGAELKIIVLDDGTQPKYLKKIQTIFPEVRIDKSPFYDSKTAQIRKFIDNDSPIGKLEIPTEFWLSSIRKENADHFILLEDDMWFTDPIDLNSIMKLIHNNNMQLLKFFHFGNKRLISGELTQLANGINSIKPKLLLENPFLFKQLIIHNRFKILSILGRMGLYDWHEKINYYTIYNVAGAIFSRDYYEYLWKGFSGLVDEDAQLIKAVEYYHKHKDKICYGVYTKDVLRTSFSSSATNMFQDVRLNVFTYNHLLNEAWFENRFEVMDGYPGDIAENQISGILQEHNHENASPAEWRKWSKRFSAHFEAVGHAI